MSDRDRGRSTAQWFCLIVGATLVLAGLFGFLAEATFDTSAGSDPGALDGENLIIFEVNGWHNIVHIASGLFLLVFAGRHRSARTAALAFGAIYGVVTVIGLIDGHDVLGVIPVNPADNVLHVLLSVIALAVGRSAAPGPRRPRDPPAAHPPRVKRAPHTSCPTLQRR